MAGRQSETEIKQEGGKTQKERNKLLHVEKLGMSETE